MAFPLGWQRVCPLVIPRGQVLAGSLSSFPVLLTAACLPNEMVTLGGANAAQSDGGDIRFSLDAAGLVPLACEVKVWSQNATPANAKAVIWVNVPTLYGSLDNTIYVWYHAASVQTTPAANSTYGSQAAWDSFYKFVWHAGDGATLNLNDSTSNANNLTNTGTVVAAAGPTNLLGAASFSGSNYLSRVASIAGLSSSAPITLEAWIYQTDNAHSRQCCTATQLVSTNATIEVLGADYAAGAYTGKLDSFLNSTVYNANTAIALSTWTRVAHIFETPVFNQYINGAIDKSNSVGAYTLTAPCIVLGSGYNGSAYNAVNNSWIGRIAEMRISNTSRSTGWLATQYANETAPTSFIVPGTPYAPGAYAAPGGFYGSRF
jgi:hypothetical protein